MQDQSGGSGLDARYLLIRAEGLTAGSNRLMLAANSRGNQSGAVWFYFSLLLLFCRLKKAKEV